jgi:hypothetical protein
VNRQNKWNGFSLSFGGKIVLVLFLFYVFSFVSLQTFYEGFLSNFDILNRKLFGDDPPSFLSSKPYHSFSILISSLLNPYFLAGLIFFYSPLIFFRKQFRENPVSYEKEEKMMVFAAAFFLCWELATYERNYYLDSAFYFDRTLLIVLAFSLLRFPAVTPLFIAFAFVYRSQFNYPIAGFELFDKRLLFDILIMFSVYRYVKIFIKDFGISFLWLALCIAGSNYFYSGVTKLIISPHGYEWLLQNNLADLFMNCHLRGWLANAGEDTINSIWSFLNSFHVPLQLIVFLIEISALFLLRNRSLSIFILCTTFLMHLGIFCCGSMLFWKWMGIDLILIFILFNKKPETFFSQKKLFMASLLVIISSIIWLRPIMIGWYDTPLNQYFTYEVEDDKGTVYQFEKNEMNPYHQWFQYDRFLWLVDKECLPVTGFGYTGKYRVFNMIRNSSSSNIRDLEQEHGRNHYNLSRAEQFTEFIQSYFQNRNKYLNDKIFITYLRAPHHLYNSSPGLLYKNQRPVKKFRVIYNLTFSSAGKSTHIDKSIVHEVAIN